jgi:hypothetical protein
MSTSSALTSEIEVVNMTLGLLGQRPLSSLDDDTETARLAKRTFAQLRESEMASFSWNFATKYAAAPNATLPAGTFGWTAAYTLPSDCLSIWNVEGESDADGEDWTREGDIILTNIVVDTGETSINIRYSWENLVVASWDAIFIDALVARCEYEWSEPLRATSTHREIAGEKYRDVKGKARHADSVQGSGKNFVTSRWDRAR